MNTKFSRVTHLQFENIYIFTNIIITIWVENIFQIITKMFSCLFEENVYKFERRHYTFS